MKKGNKLYSIFFLKCPRCHEGNLFVNQNPYSFKNFFDMPKYCDHCQLKYEPEPGFFYGAMYVSYALSIIIAGLAWFALTMLGFEFWVVIWSVVPILLIAIPALFKVSRAAWLNFFVHYSENAADLNEKDKSRVQEPK